MILILFIVLTWLVVSCFYIKSFYKYKNDAQLKVSLPHENEARLIPTVKNPLLEFRENIDKASRLSDMQRKRREQENTLEDISSSVDIEVEVIAAYAGDENVRKSIDAVVLPEFPINDMPIEMTDFNTCIVSSANPEEDVFFVELMPLAKDISWCIENVEKHQEKTKEDRLRMGEIFSQLHGTEYYDQYLSFVTDDKRYVAKSLKEEFDAIMSEVERKEAGEL